MKIPTTQAGLFSIKIDWSAMTRDHIEFFEKRKARFDKQLAPFKLSYRAWNVLMNGTTYMTVKEVKEASDKQLLGWLNLGRKCLNEIREKIK